MECKWKINIVPCDKANKLIKVFSFLSPCWCPCEKSGFFFFLSLFVSLCEVFVFQVVWLTSALTLAARWLMLNKVRPTRAFFQLRRHLCEVFSVKKDYYSLTAAKLSWRQRHIRSVATETTSRSCFIFLVACGMWWNNLTSLCSLCACACACACSLRSSGGWPGGRGGGVRLGGERALGQRRVFGGRELLSWVWNRKHELWRHGILLQQRWGSSNKH